MYIFNRYLKTFSTALVVVLLSIKLLTMFVFSPNDSEAADLFSYVPDEANVLLEPHKDIRRAMRFYKESLFALRNSDTTRALIFLDSSLASSQNMINAHELKRSLYSAQNRENELMAHYDSLKVNFPNNSLYVYLAACMMTLDESHLEYERAAMMNKYFPWPLISMGDNFLIKQDFTEAKKMYEKAMELNPAIPEVYLGLGASYEGLGDITLAEKYYEKVLLLTPSKVPEAYLYLGQISEERQDTTAFLGHYRNYLKYAMNTPEKLSVQMTYDTTRYRIAMQKFLAKQAVEDSIVAAIKSGQNQKKGKKKDPLFPDSENQ